MKRLVSALILALALGATVACHHTPPNITTPAGKVAFSADQVLVRVGELQKAAIQAEATGGLSTAQARVIVGWTTPAAKVLKETPNGAQASLSASWTVAKQKAGPITNPAILALMSAVDVALATLGGQ